MHKYNKKKKIIMIGLYLVLLLMIVGYAAFSTSLNVSSTAKVTSTWDVEITSITPHVYKESAYDVASPTYTATTASFHTGFKSPGDSMVYEVEITDKGSLDAKVATAKLNCGNNSAIKCQVTVHPFSWDDDGYTEGISSFGLLEQGSYDFSSYGVALSKSSDLYLYVVVTYDEDITEQHDNLTADVTAEVNFVQAD